MVGQYGGLKRRCAISLYSNTLAVIRAYLSNAVGDLIAGQAGVTGADTTHIHAPFLSFPDDYYNHHYFEVYVYAGTNIGLTRQVIDWVLSTKLLEVHTAYPEACDATSYIELHRIFSIDDYNKAINLAIESLAGKYLIDVKDETVVLVADTYEYDLPLNFLYLHRVTTENEAGGGRFYDSAVIDPRDWSIIKSYPPKLKLDRRYYSVTAGKDLRLEGQGSQDVVSADASLIYLPPDYIVNKAITFLPQEKIQANALKETYERALVMSARIPRNSPYPFSRGIVE